MSVVSAERQPAPGSVAPDGMTHGFVFSAAFHVILGGLFLFGLPSLFRPSEPQDMPIAVALVTVGPETRATRPNPYRPRREAKPVEAEAEAPAPLPKPKPEPPKPAPPAAEESPPPVPQPPEPKPQPPQTALAPSPPMPKPPEPKPEQPAKLEKPPPLPREKPAPPRQLAKAEPRPQEKKYTAAQFQALLKNLASATAMPDPEAPPQKPRAVSLRASSQPKAPLGSQLTTSEVDLVREQISRCWNVPAGAKEAQDLVVEIRVVVAPDGMVQQAQIVDSGRMSDPFYRAAAESARRAFFNPMCRPLRLPADKYAIWKDLVVNFSPRDVL